MCSNRYMLGAIWVIVLLGSVQAPALGHGDWDGDGDVDLDDFQHLPGCLFGPDAWLGPGCDVFDLDEDEDVDLADFAALQCVFGAPVPPPPGMALVPGGEFQMGRHVSHGGADPDELPVHAVYVDSFYIDVYEVTNQQYCAYLNSAYAQGLIDNPDDHGGAVYKADDTEPYCDTTTCSPPSRITWNGSTFGVVPDKEDHPMLEVSWYGAVAYCNWRSIEHGRTPCYDLEIWECDFEANGYRLPTEAEWEYAARGGEHNPYCKYPWGDDLDGSKANYNPSGDPYETGDFPWTTPVGYYDGGQTPAGVDMANGYGLYDMAGNESEWCHDWYDEDYYDSSPYDNPTGPDSATYRVLRGGAWNDGAGGLRCARRIRFYTPDDRTSTNGFRLAVPTSPSATTALP